MYFHLFKKIRYFSKKDDDAENEEDEEEEDSDIEDLIKRPSPE